VLAHARWVTETIERNVVDFAPGERLNPAKVLPDIWVGGRKLFEYHTLDNGLGGGYIFHHEVKLRSV
jgi:hypothetical protein